MNPHELNSVGVSSAGVPSLAGLSLPERVESLRRRMASVPSRAESVSAPIPIERIEDKTPVRPVLPVPQALARLLPHGGLARGSVVSVSGAGSLLLGLVASVTGAGSHVAVIGQPRFGLLAAAEMGAQLSKLALVRDPGPDPVEVAAILLDGVDLVVLGLGGLSVPPSRARAIVARARNKGATLVITDGHWDGVDLRLDASVQSYGGLGTGTEIGRGRVRAVQLAVRVEGKAMRPQTTSFDLRSEGSGIEWFTQDGVMHDGVVTLRAAASS